MLKAEESAGPGRGIARLGGVVRPAGSGDGARAVSIFVDNYNAIDHGDATTIQRIT